LKLVAWCLVLGAWFSPSGIEAQSRNQATKQPSNALSVYVITLGEGSALWEKFGHNSLWFLDSAAKVDEVYNWGTFDFNAPGFAWRFVTGETKYWVDMFPGGQVVIDFFSRRDRTIDVQRLNLTPAQATRALAFARNNALDANKFYRYDYYRDNCSTRIRDLIDVVTDGAVKAASTGTTPYSFRSESVRLTDDLFFAQLGIAAALGRPGDRPITVWEDAFVPMRLRDLLRGVRVTIDGKQAPLVVEERRANTTHEHTELADVPSIWRVPLIIGLVIAIDLLGLGIIGERHHGVDIAFRAEVSVWALLTGLLGVGILFAWMFTHHDFWDRNESLLVVNPLAIWLAPLAILSARNARWARPAAITAVLIALCSAVALVLYGIPGAGQQNLAVLALTVPVNFAVAFGLWRRSATVTP
jgi:hypothetical protein